LEGLGIGAPRLTRRRRDLHVVGALLRLEAAHGPIVPPRAFVLRHLVGRRRRRARRLASGTVARALARRRRLARRLASLWRLARELPHLRRLATTAAVAALVAITVAVPPAITRGRAAPVARAQRG